MRFDEYCELATNRQNLRSYAQLAQRLGISGTSLSNMRAGKIYPSDATMRRLAELAGVDAREALLDLALWRVSDGPTRAVYAAMLRDLKRSLAKTAAAVLAVVMVLNPGQKSDAQTPAPSERPRAGAIYIMLSLLRWLTDHHRFRAHAATIA